MQEASNALSKTADSDTVSTYRVSSVQLVIDKKLEVFIKHSLDRHPCGTYTRSTVVDGLSVLAPLISGFCYAQISE